MVPDTSNADDNFTPHPNGGPYGFIVKDATDVDEHGIALTRKDGTPIARVILKPDTAKTDAGEDRSDVWCQFTLEERFLFKIQEFQMATELPTNGAYPWDRFVGKRVNAYIDHSEYNGKTYANVTAFESNGDPKDQSEPAKKSEGDDDDLPF